jgi:hemerythrin-like metal-binding protein
MWTNNLSVGVKELDEGNKRLVKMVNELHYAIQDGSASGTIEKDEIEIVLHRLHNYAKYHCKLEEQLLASIGYIDLEAQKADHQQLAATVADMTLRFHNSTNIGDATEIMRFAYDWLTNHVYVTDMKFVDYLPADDSQPKRADQEKAPSRSWGSSSTINTSATAPSPSHPSFESPRRRRQMV